jgi:Leucine-rich repeat (LRR) protein
LDHVIGFDFATFSVKRADLAVLLKSFPDLQDLRFAKDDRIPGSPGITDAHLEPLQGLTNLRSLSLISTQVTGGGLAHLLPLTKLKRLSLYNSANVQDPGLLYVARFKQLESLNLNYTKITDAGLAHLKTLTSLENLDLYGTGVTDAGVVHLKALKSLKTIDLRTSGVTNAGQEELLKALPNLKAR